MAALVSDLQNHTRTICFRRIVTLRDSSRRALEAMLGRLGRYWVVLRGSWNASRYNMGHVGSAFGLARSSEGRREGERELQDHLTPTSRANRFGRLAQAGPKSEESELPKETLSSVGEEDWLHSCRIVKITQTPYFCRRIVTSRDSSWRGLEALLERLGRH